MRNRILVTGALLVGLLAGATGVSAIGPSTQETEIRAGLLNCLLDAEARRDGFSARTVLVTHLGCRAFRAKYHIP